LVGIVVLHIFALQNKTNIMIKFSRTQMQHIENGAAIRQRLVQLAKKSAKSSVDSDYPHTYFFSEAGLGKTHTITQALIESKVPYQIVSGNISMFAFGLGLACIKYEYRDKPVVILVDDCDEIFKTPLNINIMKNVLDGSKVYSYEKSLQSQINNLTEFQQDAIASFSSEKRMGFEVPTDKMKFLFASNFKLPTDSDVKYARSKGQQKAVMLGHLNAIRSRCQPADFDLDENEQWGWIADVVLNEKCTSLTKEKNMILLDWMYSNWDAMNEHSIRTVKKMAEVMKNNPQTYRDTWEIDYLM
jgi:hypothetical protein